jgi:hypothetical protein
MGNFRAFRPVALDKLVHKDPTRQIRVRWR